MSEPLHPDTLAAKVLGCSPEEVAKIRGDWSRNRIMRHVLSVRLKAQIEERRTRLETCLPDDLKKAQGEIAGLRLAISTLSQNEK